MSSSEAVGCTAMVFWNCEKVIFCERATARGCMSSSTPSPTRAIPSMVSSSPTVKKE